MLQQSMFEGPFVTGKLSQAHSHIQGLFLFAAERALKAGH